MNFSGKTIAIIGPTEDILDKKEGGYIDNHDIVIRIKVPPELYPFTDQILTESIGTKMDICYQPRFIMYYDSSGEIIDIVEIKQPHFNKINKLLSSTRFIMVTMGGTAVFDLLMDDSFKKLTIRGLTFYHGGENIFKKQLGIKNSNIPSCDLHDGDAELHLFKSLIKDKMDRLDLSDRLMELINPDSSLEPHDPST